MNKDCSFTHKKYKECKYSGGSVYYGIDSIYIDSSVVIKMHLVLLVITVLTFIFLKGWGVLPLLVLFVMLFISRSGGYGTDPLMDKKIFICKDLSVKGLSFRGYMRQRDDIGTINGFTTRLLSGSYPLTYGLMAVGSRRDIIVLAHKDPKALIAAKRDLNVFFGFL